MNLMKRKQEIEARLTEIRGLVSNESDVEKLTAFETEVDKLQEERTMIEKKMNIASKSDYKPTMVTETKSKSNEELEARGKAIKEGRVIQVSSEEILTNSFITALRSLRSTVTPCLASLYSG